MIDQKLLGKKIYVLDGAMDTMLLAGGVEDPDPERVNLTHPAVVADVYREYIEAGVDIIRSNTFGADSLTQKDFGLEKKAADMTRAGIGIAREAADAADAYAGRPIYVAGTVGPTSLSLSLSAQLGNQDGEEAVFQAFQTQIRLLSEGGADLLHFSAFQDLHNARLALQAWQETAPETPALLTFFIGGKSGEILSGHTLKECYEAVRDFPLTGFGIESIEEGNVILGLVKDLNAWCRFPIICLPGAGLPGDASSHDQKPIVLACDLRKATRRGLLNFAGGGMGTASEHLCAIATALQDEKIRKIQVGQWQKKRPRVAIEPVLGDLRQTPLLVADALRKAGFDIPSKNGKKDPDLLCMGSLSLPGLLQAEAFCRQLAARNADTPLLLWGNASSPRHCLHVLNALYPHCYYANDITALTDSALRCATDRNAFEVAEQARYRELLDQKARSLNNQNIQANPLFKNRTYVLTDKRFLHSKPTFSLSLGKLAEIFGWEEFLSDCGCPRTRSRSKVKRAARQDALQAGKELFQKLIDTDAVHVRVSVRVVDACNDDDCICFIDRYKNDEAVRLPMLRQEEDSPLVTGLRGRFSIADFVPDKSFGKMGPIGFFAATMEVAQEAVPQEDETQAARFQFLRKGLMKAAIRRIRDTYASILKERGGKGFNIALPLVGEEACPDVSLRRDILEHLPAPSALGITLDGEFTPTPADTVFGLILFHHHACCPVLGEISAEQWEAYRKKRGLS